MLSDCVHPRNHPVPRPRGAEPVVEAVQPLVDRRSLNQDVEHLARVIDAREREREAEIEPDRLQDYRRRKAMTLKLRLHPASALWPFRADSGD